MDKTGEIPHQPRPIADRPSNNVERRRKRRRRIIIVALGVLTVSALVTAMLVTNRSPEPATIGTIAGTATSGFSGDGGPATQAGLTKPDDPVPDAAGNLYIPDTGNNRIRRITADGTITTIAGTGKYDFSGDGGPATQAHFATPTDVMLDAAGNLYIADTDNNRIRRVTTDGTITTIAGTGIQGFSGDGGPATQAHLAKPTDMALDAAGNLYIADTDNNRIRRITTDGTITTIAGTGTGTGTDIQGFSGDGGPATQAHLTKPGGVVVDAAGNLYIADNGNNRIRRVTADGTITTIAGTGAEGFSGDGGPATQAHLANPGGVVVDAAGNLYIADTDNNRIRRVTTDGTITTIAGTGIQGFSGDGGPATQADLATPNGLGLDMAGNLYISDNSNNRIRRIRLGT
ncbi:NHL repeat-containing protein [Frankia sp. Cppng1_Ct_nod]|uniref:NHL repeat-containing protein n=1 Tax=Frankia sp. Cppng1_Ct_nod TaxID=2897162 RepID=UPI002025750F|nr:NHL repeat-containing protein [Frankia sp. Cppng1_Ct_nod]